MKILLSIFGAASLFGCSFGEQIKKNEKVEPAHTIALGLKQSTICEVYMVDDSYPNGRQIENGKPLHATVSHFQFDDHLGRNHQPYTLHISCFV